VRWVADQLGHADPALTLRVYAHAMPQQEEDLSFAEFEPPETGAGIGTDANPTPTRYQIDASVRGSRHRASEFNGKRRERMGLGLKPSATLAERYR
jgi:hypothetical protein